MLSMIVSKILSNNWKVISLLVGSILAVGMVCSIPIYANGILQRLLTRDLETFQTSTQRYPGYLVLSSNYNQASKEVAAETVAIMRSEHDRMVVQMPVDPQVTLEILQVSNLFYFEEPGVLHARQSLAMNALTDFKAHVQVDRGRMYDTARSDGVIEAVVTDAALKNLNLLLDREYELFSYRQAANTPRLLTVKIVGVISAQDNQDLYWYQNTNAFGEFLLVDFDTLEGLVADIPVLNMANHQLVGAFNYYQFRIQDVPTLQAIQESGVRLAERHARTTLFITTYYDIIERYFVRAAELKLSLQILVVPILLMLVFYIFMVAQLIIRSETNIISVLESRGAARWQILLLYCLETALFGLVTLIFGPILGLWMVRIIGAANGFLEFVNRQALSVSLDRQVLFYAVLAVLLIMLATLLPVFIQARISIVEQKRKKSRAGRAPLWQRIFLDIILLGISLYAFYRLRAQLALQKETGYAGIEMDLDFLLFISSTVFILGSGLLFLRLYPWLLRLLFYAGRRFWNPMLYASLHQISHSDGQERFLMLFLILALSIGLFNANAARTINRNAEDTIRSRVGSDIQLQEFWQQYDSSGLPIGDGSGGDQVVRYAEPRFSRYADLDGVASAARVLRLDNTRIRQGMEQSGLINLIAVDPYDFARTAWSRSDLYRHHLNDYMNVLLTMPNAVILSSDLREELNLSVGDGIIYTIDHTDRVDGVIIAFVDFWTGFQPVVTDRRGQAVEQSLIVANLDFVFSQTALRPYQVWLRRTPQATDAQIYEAIATNRISLTRIQSASQMITAAKNDPQLQGTNGALTLGFLVSMLICAIGFLIYWIIAVQRRVLQFGVFRAMGLSKVSVIGMLFTEQVLISGVAVALGLFLGNLSSFLFVPLFQLAYSSAEQPIPFRVISDPGDTGKILLILGLLLLLCLGILIRIVMQIKIDQAVKLGED